MLRDHNFRFRRLSGFGRILRLILKLMEPGEPESGRQFFPMGAIFFFALLIVFYAVLWLVVYWIMVARA
jgi:hypothetical protein